MRVEEVLFLCLSYLRHSVKPPHACASTPKRRRLLAHVKGKTKVEVPPHLRLGLNLAAYRKFVKEELWKVGFDPRSTSIRSQYPESLFWIAEQYGDRCTGYDQAEATKMWLRMNNAEDKSVCEVLKELSLIHI